jgi:hypothetical protein
MTPSVTLYTKSAGNPGVCLDIAENNIFWKKKHLSRCNAKIVCEDWLNKKK